MSGPGAHPVIPRLPPPPSHLSITSGWREAWSFKVHRSDKPICVVIAGLAEARCLRGRMCHAIEAWILRGAEQWHDGGLISAIIVGFC